MLARLFKKLQDLAARAADDRYTVRRTVRGLPVVVVNTRPDIDTEQVIARLDDALGLIERYQPWHFRRFHRDFSEIWVRRYPCRGAYLSQYKACLVELTFTVNPDFTTAQIAATMLHEAMHARLDRRCIEHTAENAAKHDRFCRRAEIEFGRMVPGGEPIVARALATLDAPDEDVAPAIDWQIAAQRVADVDRAALEKGTQPRGGRRRG